MTEHVHGCLICRPDMVPDFSHDDPRYCDGAKCRDAGHGGICYAFVDGVDVHYCLAAFEGPEGWALHAGDRGRTDLIHLCPCGDPDRDAAVCVEPRFGRVEIRHSDGAA